MRNSLFKPFGILILLFIVLGAIYLSLSMKPSLPITFVKSVNFDERECIERDSTTQKCLRYQPVDTVVLHATEVPTMKHVLAIFASTEYKVSAHYTIDCDGSIIQHVHEEHRAWHAGLSKMPDGREKVNDFSIGIELVNLNNGKDEYPMQQLDSLTKLLIEILKRRPEVQYIVSHALIAKPEGRKTDPAGFQFRDLQKKLSALTDKKLIYPDLEQ
jgi:N-acetyl-anhydromuramyl-L-alanine amidase AmpD